MLPKIIAPNPRSNPKKMSEVTTASVSLWVSIAVLSRRMVPRIRMMRTRISTTNCVIAMSGAPRNRNATERANPTALTEITADNRFRVSMATIDPITMKTRSV